jgi:methyl-accepting chemotaxis protein
MKKPFKIRTLLTFFSLFYITMLVLIGGLGAYETQQQSRSMQSLYADRVLPLSQLKKIADMYAVNIVDTAHKSRDGALTRQQAIDAIDQAKVVIAEEWAAYTSTYLVPKEQTLIGQLKPLMKAADDSVVRLAALINAGDRDALAAYTASEMYPAFDPMQGVIGELIQLQLDVSREAYEGSVSGVRFLLWAMGLATLGAVALGAAAAWWITRKLTRQLGAEPIEVVHLARAVSEGDLTQDVVLRQGDRESIMAAMKEMIARLTELIEGVRQSAIGVASASTQIAQGNSDLSQRTEEQASALEETSASMEEIGTTVLQNTEHVGQASQLAQTANALALQGGDAVQRVVATMKTISDSSQRMGDIVGVIDGIAFQTNLLALNAAVEAARAGEQGRGFAVVASEVRVLAQRSAEAAREIKGLIASSATHVGQGLALVDRAGSTMGEVVGSIQRVSQLMSEVSVASREQSAGIAQVGSAVSQMDQATQQNAALVEESAAAAASLQNQASGLVKAASVFRTLDRATR